jgi:hypothetical protein
LQWAVTNNTSSYFTVERRKEEGWFQLASIPSSANKVEYSFRDSYLTPGTYQYRVKVVSNQSIGYSSIQQVIIKGSEQAIRYDPLKQQVFVWGMDKDDLLQIFDISGKCIYQKRFMSSTAEWHFNTSFLKKGVYIARTAKTAIKFMVTP